MQKFNKNKEKSKIDLHALKKIFLYIKPFYLLIAISIVCAILGTVGSIIGPEKIMDLMNVITNGIFTGVDFSALIDIAIFLIIIYVLSSVFAYVQQYIMAHVTQKSAKKLRTNIDTKINKLPLSYFDKNTKGDILSRVTNDVDTISETLGSSIANLISAVVLFLGVTIKMFTINWLLALVTIGTSLIGMILMAIILKKSQKYFNERQKFLGDLNGHIEETYTNFKVVKSFNAKQKEKEKFEINNQNIRKSEWKSQFLSGLMMPIMAFSGNLSYLSIFVVGVAVIVNGGTTVTVGTLVGFVIYAKLFSQPLQTFAQSMTSLQQTSAASKRVFEILEQPELEDESSKTETITNIKGAVEFRNVKFGYNEDKLIIKNFSANLKAGQKVAIVGPTGAGKTTLVNLLMRFYETNEGDILIDGKSIKNMTRETVHDLFDMILQDTWIFNGTLRDNLVYNKENVSNERLDEVCKAVGLEHFVKTLEKGYDSNLDENSSLSEGQKQQITIARAMIKDSPLLILDEATSNVDTRTELVIQKAMDELTKGRTSFVIAHRLSTIKNADVILVLKDGDIIEQGNHNELLQQKGFYADLYNSQFTDI